MTIGRTAMPPPTVVGVGVSVGIGVKMIVPVGVGVSVSVGVPVKCEPSGTHSGKKSPPLTVWVSRVWVLPSRLVEYKSLIRPSRFDIKTSSVPSGEKVG